MTLEEMLLLLPPDMSHHTTEEQSWSREAVLEYGALVRKATINEYASVATQFSEALRSLADAVERTTKCPSKTSKWPSA